jgi:hypothetical protein
VDSLHVKENLYWGLSGLCLYSYSRYVNRLVFEFILKCPDALQLQLSNILELGCMQPCIITQSFSTKTIMFSI